jgi:hypothetical protein
MTVVPEPERGQSERQYFSMSPELSLVLLACLKMTNLKRLLRKKDYFGSQF